MMPLLLLSPPDILPMSLILQVLAVVGVMFAALFIVAWLLARTRGAVEKYPYDKIPVLTDTELTFFETLQMCRPEGTLLLMKVRLADFLEVTERGDGYLKYFGRISQKHADFLLVEEATAKPLLVIELDDSTHRNRRRTMESDQVKNRIYAAAGLSILRVPAARKYNQRDLENQIRSALIH